MDINISSLDKDTLVNLVCMYYAHLKKENPKYKQCFPCLNDLASYAGLSKATVKNRKQAYDEIFDDNGRKGWYSEGNNLEARSEVKKTYDLYNDLSIDELEKITVDIMEFVRGPRQRPIFSIKTKDEVAVNKILASDKQIEFDGLNVLKDSIHIGDLVFIVLGGDKPNWDTGLIGLGFISKEPYDEGYSGKNFKVQIDIKILLRKPIKREDLVPYADTYGIIGIAPIVKWEPNQAITQVEYLKAVALLRAMLEIEPSILQQLSEVVPEFMLNEIKGFTTKMVPVEMAYDGTYNKDETDLTSEQIEDGLDNSEDYDKNDFLSEVFISEEKYDTIVNLLKIKKNIILSGAPGVGKTFMAKRLAYSILGKKKDSNICFVQFHQNYSYEDFVMGYRANDSGFKLETGPFYDFCILASKSKAPYFFIIDEINRANLSKVFGELLMLTEASHRNERISLAYDKAHKFCVPDNVYIIGMMNTADRSLAIIDYALRRRFAFVPIVPAFENAEFKRKFSTDAFVSKLLSEIKNLNNEIRADDNLGDGFCIGHSYFCHEELDIQKAKAIIDFEIIPLIQEYWYDEPTKVEKWISNFDSLFSAND